MKSKKCRSCSEVKTIDNFYKGGRKTKAGVDIMDNLCKNCKADGSSKGYSKENILKEINKCMCLCSRCHAEIHSK